MLLTDFGWIHFGLKCFSFLLNYSCYLFLLFLTNETRRVVVFVVVHAVELTCHLFVWQLLQMPSEQAWDPKAWTRWSVTTFCLWAYVTSLLGHTGVSNKRAF